MSLMKYKFRFECKGCGSCCREEGYVFFSRVEIKRASEFLKISAEEFIRRFLIKQASKYAHSVAKGGYCVFLKRNRCMINSVKPKQCATFPYWKEYVTNKGELVNFTRKCEGIEYEEKAASHGKHCKKRSVHSSLKKSRM